MKPTRANGTTMAIELTKDDGVIEACKATLALARTKALKLQQLVAETVNTSVDRQEKKTARRRIRGR